LLKLAPLFALPAIPFLLWRQYADGVNARQPDWFFLPTYFRYDNLNFWFFGPLEMRFELDNWLSLEWRIFFEILTPIGVALFAFGMCRLRGHRNFSFLSLWIAGAFVAVVIFFRLNVVHSYYQNPLIAIAAVGIAGLFWHLLSERSPVPRARLAAVAIGFAAFALSCVCLAEFAYYPIDWPTRHAAGALAEMTREDDLVVAVSPLIQGAQDPRILGLAHRYGWPLDQAVVTPEILERLRQEGATAVAWVQTAAPVSLPGSVQEYLSGAAVEVRDLPGGDLRHWTADPSAPGWQRFLAEILPLQANVPEIPPGGARLVVYRLDGLGQFQGP
jgi:hypothetical protein